MKYHIVTLGCPKNSVDSEGMGGILAAQGHSAVARPGEADVVIVNTCSFIAAAREETLGVLREIKRVAKGVGGRAALDNRRKVENGQYGHRSLSPAARGRPAVT